GSGLRLVRVAEFVDDVFGLEHDTDLRQRKAHERLQLSNAPVPFDLGTGIAPFAPVALFTGRHEADLLPVPQGAGRDPAQLGDLPDAQGVRRARRDAVFDRGHRAAR